MELDPDRVVIASFLSRHPRWSIDHGPLDRWEAGRFVPGPRHYVFA